MNGGTCSDKTGVYIALIRGINVGRAKRVSMAGLRALFADLGYGHVRTHLNSGNVVFTAIGLDPGETAKGIERGLAANLGVTARVLVLTAAELTAAVDQNSLLNIADNPSRLLVAFLADPADRRRVEPLAGEDWTPEALAMGPRVAYLWCPEGVLASRLPGAIGGAVTDVVTMRNWSTVTKLQALAQDQRQALGG